MLARNLESTAVLMKVLGWTFFPLLFAMNYFYPHGFAWGIETETQWHPYVWMMFSLYLAWCYLLVREAKKPADAGLLFDFGIISSILHGLVMVVLAIMMWEHEMPHMWADIPMIFAVAYVLWLYHPKRVTAH